MSRYRLEMAAQIAGMREQGLRWHEIGERLGISKSTAWDYFNDPSGEKARARKAKTDGVCIDCGGRTVSDGGYAPPRCNPCRREWEKTPEGRRSHSVRRPDWSDEQLFAAIRSCALDGVVSLDRYRARYGTAPAGSMPSDQTIIKRFGWARGVELAGCRTRSGPRRQRVDRTPERGCLLAVEECVTALGLDRSPTYSEYCDWASGVGAVSGQTVRNRFGSWVAATEAYEAGLVEVAA